MGNRPYKNTPEFDLIALISEQQNIQKTCPWHTADWIMASKKLAPMFDEMAHRNAEDHEARVAK